MNPVRLVRNVLFYCANTNVELVVTACKAGVIRVLDKTPSRTYSVRDNRNMDLKNKQSDINPLAHAEGFKFEDYDCIGFDLDNTVCRYKVSNMVKMEYECLANFLIKNRGYSDKYLKRPIEENVDFMIKGLILDVKKGNILRIAPDGQIMHGTHGTKELTLEELHSYYGPTARWNVTDVFTKNPLHTWNGPMSENMRTLLDYFDMPAGLVFARAVDTLDEIMERKPPEYNIYPHIVDALQDMFQKEHFQQSKGGYFPTITSNPENYIHQCSDRLINWLKQLKSKQKILFLITGSNVDFASYTASNSMGPKWRELFDIVICFAKKPGFFTERRPFMALDGFIETHAITDEQLARNQVYTYGNWKALHSFLKKITQKDNPKVLYVGDNLIQDVYTPAVHTDCDTVAVCEELEAEGMFGHEPSHYDKDFLTSSLWGSYFHHKDETNSTIWKEIIKKHAKLCIPSLEYVAQYPINHNFC